MHLGLVLVVLCQCLVVFSQENDTLLSVQVLYRHGDRTPIQTYPNDPHKDSLYLETGPGQLTNKGKLRQYNLGKWLRTRYDGFLPTKYSNNDIKIYTDNDDRCFMSAMSNLAGLYPPKGQQDWNKNVKWQPIPVRFNMTLQTPTNCPAYNKLYSESGEKIFNNFKSENGELLEYIIENSGENITDLGSLYLSIIDPLTVEDKQGLKLPEWTEKVYPKPALEWGSLLLGVGVSSPQLARFTVGPVLQNILERFENINEKMIMYSSHDSTLLEMVSILSPTYPIFNPEYASIAILELWQSKKGKYVKFTLKQDDKVEELKMQNCGVNCNLAKFKTLVNPIATSLERREQLCKQ